MAQDTDDLSIAEFIADPIATIGTAVAVISGGLSGVLEPLLATVWNQAGALFAFASVSSTTLAAELEWLPAETLTTAAVVAGVVFAANRLWMVVQGYQNQTDD